MKAPTEQEFCKDVLQAHFNRNQIYLHCPVIKKSGGGIVAWNVLKKQIENHLIQEKDAFVTTLIKGYKKIVYGAILAESIGLISIRQRSPRFNNWVASLESS